MNPNITPNGSPCAPTCLPDSGRLLNIARKLYEIAEFSDAEYLLRILLQLEPENVDARILLASILVAQEKVDEAESVLREAEKINDNARIHFMLSGVYMLKGDEERAYQEYGIAINMQKVMSR
jgi:predicted negative regulator of RcsB-dependent stress response